MEGSCSTGQSPQRAVVPVEEEEFITTHIYVTRLRHKNSDTLCCDLNFTNFSYYYHNSFFFQVAHLRQKCHNSKFVIFREKILKILKCYNFLWVRRRHNCSSAASFANCVMKLYLLKEHLQTFLSTPVTQKCQILSCDTPVAHEQNDVHKNMQIKLYVLLLLLLYVFSLIPYFVYWISCSPTCRPNFTEVARTTWNAEPAWYRRRLLTG
jgi:hypothetical protein